MVKPLITRKELHLDSVVEDDVNDREDNHDTSEAKDVHEANENQGASSEDDENLVSCKKRKSIDEPDENGKDHDGF